MIKIELNKNEEFVAEMRKKLKESHGFCPCMIEQTEDTRCMCKEFRDQESGECHCGLYTKYYSE